MSQQFLVCSWQQMFFYWLSWLQNPSHLNSHCQFYHLRNVCRSFFVFSFVYALWLKQWIGHTIRKAKQNTNFMYVVKLLLLIDALEPSLKSILFHQIYNNGIIGSIGYNADNDFITIKTTFNTLPQCTVSLFVEFSWSQFQVYFDFWMIVANFNKCDKHW